MIGIAVSIVIRVGAQAAMTGGRLAARGAVAGIRMMSRGSGEAVRAARGAAKITGHLGGLATHHTVAHAVVEANKLWGFGAIKDADGRIIMSGEPSPLGSPPHTRQGDLPGAIAMSDVDVSEGHLGTLLGPMYSAIGDIGGLHEFGGEYMGQQYPARPFMGLTLEQAVDDAPEVFEGMFGS